MRILLILAFVLFLSTLGIGQRSDCQTPSVKSETESIGANIVTVNSRVQRVSVIEGSVKDPVGGAIPTAIIDVYKVDKFDKKLSAADQIGIRNPAGSYRVNENGEFCIGGLADGYYVLRIGTDVFAFCHLFIKVRKSSSFSRKKIKIGLELGT